VSSRRTRIARVAEQISVVTSQIFRCKGLDHVSPQADRLGTHDLFYWILFISAISAWYLYLFIPQKERLTALHDRRHTLEVHLREENKERRRLERGIRALFANDPTAWERAARGKLGWVEPGELTDMVAWRRNRVVPMPPVPPRAEAPALPQPAAPNNGPVLQRPNVPALPVPPESLRSAGLRLDAAPSLEAAVAARRRALLTAPIPPPLPRVPGNVAGIATNRAPAHAAHNRRVAGTLTGTAHRPAELSVRTRR